MRALKTSRSGQAGQVRVGDGVLGGDPRGGLGRVEVFHPAIGVGDDDGTEAVGHVDRAGVGIHDSARRGGLCDGVVRARRDEGGEGESEGERTSDGHRDPRRGERRERSAATGQRPAVARPAAGRYTSPLHRQIGEGNATTRLCAGAGSRPTRTRARAGARRGAAAHGGGRWRRAHESEILREFRDLLAVPNRAADSANIRRNAALVSAMLQRRGVTTRLLESPTGGPPAVYGELRRRARRAPSCCTHTMTASRWTRRSGRLRRGRPRCATGRSTRRQGDPDPDARRGAAGVAHLRALGQRRQGADHGDARGARCAAGGRAPRNR